MSFDNQQPLANKIALVTGAASERGIGFASARRMAQAGASVIITDIPSQQSQLEQRVKALTNSGLDCLGLSFDLTDLDQINSAMQQAIAWKGGIDILFNNAGCGLIKPFMETPPEDFDRLYAINVKGIVAMIQATIPSMQSRNGGSIINNASTSGLYAEAFFSAYNMTKFGLIGLSKSLALEFGPDNIRVNAICPGATDTEMMDQMIKTGQQESGCSYEEVKADISKDIALGRLGRPEEIAEVVLLLASAQGGFITGSAIPVAGGFPVAI